MNRNTGSRFGSWRSQTEGDSGCGRSSTWIVELGTKEEEDSRPPRHAGRSRGMNRNTGSRFGSWRSQTEGDSGCGRSSTWIVDGTELHYARIDQMEKESGILERFKKSLRCLGGYSEDEEGNFSNDNHYMPFFNTDYLPDPVTKKIEVDFDLKQHEKEAKLYTLTPRQKLENYFSWILSNKENSASELYEQEPKFIALKNVFSMILQLPIQFALEKKFYAVCVNGNIYLLNEIFTENFEGKEKIERWGHQFENCLTFAENEGAVCNWGYRTVLSSKIGPHKLYYSGAIDAVNPDLYDKAMKDLSACVAFKCCLDPGKNDKRNFERFKMLGWCVGTSLNGVPRTIVGFRNFNGIIKELYLFDQEDMIKRGQEFWNLDALFTFTERVLDFVRTVTEAKPGTVFEFIKSSRSSFIRATKTSEVKEFPPDWFIEEFI